MSETLKSNTETTTGSEWDNMKENLSVIARLQNGDDPEAIIQEAYENHNLTPDFLEEHAEEFLQYDLNSDKLEKYEKMARNRLNATAEDKRRRFDEEPEQSGYETKAI